ncbi:peptidoglycan-binding protein LysM [Melaminivora alkalimesophila]|uniref:Potassium binding protein Kbp n=1 Tax=Melaminivora alkalimesophila TaxID=1165852 RepID=A0A317R8A4_9BURK|nr:peptidoglycan-binding protein LysM [Melaminivora alkalimesophila]PWW43759.1 nucleoid-associated protein YgaU [Melaminivora alkalimesophila]
MGLFSFVKEAGEKLFGGKEAHAAAPAQAPAAAPTAAAPSQEELNARAAQAIENYIASQKLGVSDVKVKFEGPEGKVTVTGTAPDQATKEKVTLCCGNVASVTSVDNQMAVTNPEPEAQYHDVVRGDTLSAIAKKYYGDANKYPVIFEANKPMLTHPDKIYPGQKLRIPPLAK